MNAIAPITLMLRHEARLNWRIMSARVTHKVMIWTLIGLLVLMHLVALPFPFVVSEMPTITRIDVLAAVTGAGAATLFTMMSLAMIGTVKLIYARADMDLLLSSPVPAQAVILVRMLAIMLGILGMAGIFILPFANLMAVFGYPRFLLAYVALLGLALLATAIGMMLAMGLFWLFGARRTRLIAQLFAGLLGMVFLCAVNLHNILPNATQSVVIQNLADLVALVPSADSWVWLPARAALGEPLPFVIAVMLCAGLFAVTMFGFANRLIGDAIAANGAAGKTVTVRGGSRMLARSGGPVAVMRRKEWLLIGRDPWLVSQIMMQLLMMLPCVFVIWQAGSTPTYLWLAVVFLVGQLAGMLAWLTMSTEEAPDLLATAPVSRRGVIVAKLQAALIPTAVIAAVPIAVACHVGAWLGFTILLCSAGSALSTSLLHLRHSAPAKRSELSRRGNDNKVLAIFEALLAMMWIVLGALMLALGWWGVLALVVILPAAARMVR